MDGISVALLDQFAAGCREVAAHGLVRCSSGNLSWRIGDDLMLIKPTRTWMGDATRDGVAACRIGDGAVVYGAKPSVEIGFHARVLRRRRDVNVVLHCQTPFATTLGCSGRGEIDYNVIPEVPYYIGPIARVPYCAPGSGELAEAVASALETHDLVQMANHGQATVGVDFRHAIQNAAFFELACEIVWRAGAGLQTIDPETAAALRRARTAHAGGGA